MEEGHFKEVRDGGFDHEDFRAIKIFGSEFEIDIEYLIVLIELVFWIYDLLDTVIEREVKTFFHLVEVVTGDEPLGSVLSVIQVGQSVAHFDEILVLVSTMLVLELDHVLGQNQIIIKDEPQLVFRVLIE